MHYFCYQPAEFDQALHQLLQQDAARQISGAKRLSALLKPQTMTEDAPIEIVQLDSSAQERRTLLRRAWSTAIDDGETASLGLENEASKARNPEASKAPRAGLDSEGQAQDEVDDQVLLSTLGFGDLTFDMVAEALGAVEALGLLPRRGGEVGGGTMVDFTARGGQFALAAALLHPFDYVLGVEGGEERCELARGRLESLQTCLAHVVGDDDGLTWEVSFEHSADSTDKDVEESGLLAADLVAINSAGLNALQVNDLGEAMLGLRPHAVIINFGRRIPCPGAHLLDTRMLPSQHWDDFPCYIMQRVTDSYNEHLPPVALPCSKGHPQNRESGDLQRAAAAALPRLAELMGGAAAVAAAREPLVASSVGKVGGEGKALRGVAGAGAGDAAADVRNVAAMALSYCAHRYVRTQPCS